MPPPVCPRCCGCKVYSTDFQDWDVQPLNGFYSDLGWSFEPDQSGDTPPHFVWEVETVVGGAHLFHAVKSATLGSGPWKAIYLGTLPRHLSVTTKINFRQESGVFNITYQAVSLADSSDAKRIKLQVGMSDTRDTTSKHCGFMRLWDTTNLFAPTALTDAVPVPGLCYNASHTYTLCYDPETELFSCTVKLFQNGEIHALHANGVTTPADPLDAPEAWLEVEDWGVDFANEFVVVNFAVKQTKNLDMDNDGYGDDGYGFGDDELTTCPCCGPRDCQAVAIDFTNPDNDGKEAHEIDCRMAGSDTQSDGSFVGAFSWLGSWSGLTSDCRVDDTTKATVTPSFESDGEFVTIQVGTATATLTRDSESTATLTVDEVDTPIDIPVDSFSLCANSSECVAEAGGVAAVGTGGGKEVAVSSSAKLFGFGVTHNVNDFDCPNCGGTGDSCCAGILLPGSLTAIVTRIADSAMQEVTMSLLSHTTDQFTYSVGFFGGSLPCDEDEDLQVEAVGIECNATSDPVSVACSLLTWGTFTEEFGLVNRCLDNQLHSASGVIISCQPFHAFFNLPGGYTVEVIE